MPSCAVPSCNTNHRNCKHRGLTLHKFPKRSESLCKMWKRKCRNPCLRSIANAVVCSKHFPEDAYERDLQSELLGLPAKRMLLKNAVPTLFLTHSKCDAPSDFEDDLRTQRVLQMQNLPPTCAEFQGTDISSGNGSLHSEMLSLLEPDPHEAMDSSPRNGKENDKDLPYEEEQPNLDRVIQKRTDTNKDLQRQITNLQAQVEIANDTSSRSTAKLDGLRIKSQEWYRKWKKAEAELQLCKVKCKQLRKQCARAKDGLRFRAALLSRLTDCQINCMLRKKFQSKKWGDQDVAEALTLRYLSRNAYRHIRMKKIHYPGLTTLRNWTAKFHCSPGTLNNALQVLNCQSYTDIQKKCVLIFNEIALDPRMSYDDRCDAIVGPHSMALVAMIRGLYKDWQQPVYYRFDTCVTKEITDRLITQVEDIGYQVVGCILDSRVCEELCLTAENPSFPNPSDVQRNVWVFADIPCAILRLRNRFLEHGFTLISGKKLTKDCIEMLNASRSRREHVDVEVQRVDLAMRLFSQSVAQGLKKNLHLPEEGDIFQMISDFTDVCGSSVREDKRNVGKSGYGFDIKVQDEVLKSMKLFIENLAETETRNMLQHEKGILLSIASIQGLFRDLQELGNSYLPTQRLTNTDCLKDFLNRIREKGKVRENLLASEFQSRLLLSVLGVDVESDSSAIISQPHKEKVVTSLLLSETSQAIPAHKILQDGEDVRDILDDELIEVVLKEANSEDAALKYVAGYVAFRCRDVDSSLGMDVSRFVSEIPSWLSSPSSLRLSHLDPSEEWYEKVKQFEVVFQEIHGSTLSNFQRVVFQLQNRLRDKYPDIHKTVISVYARTRTIMRIKYLNMHQLSHE